MKQSIIVLLISLLFASSAVAYDCPIGVDDNTILDGLEIVATEINSYNHSDKAMKKSYRKLCRIEKILKKQRGRDCRTVPANIEDADLLSFIDAIATEVQDNDHRQRKMFFTSIKINRLNRLLIKRRTSPQVDDIAVLELSSSDPFNLGSTLANGILSTSFIVSNSGTGSASSIVVAVAAPFSVTGGSCTTITTLAAGATCTVAISFTSPTPGNYVETLEVGYDNGVDADLITKELQATVN